MALTEEILAHTGTLADHSLGWEHAYAKYFTGGHSLDTFQK